MKKFHICFYITLFFISACSDFKGNEDDVEASLSSTPSSNSNTNNTSYKKLNAVTTVASAATQKLKAATIGVAAIVAAPIFYCSIAHNSLHLKVKES